MEYYFRRESPVPASVKLVFSDEPLLGMVCTSLLFAMDSGGREGNELINEISRRLAHSSILKRTSFKGSFSTNVFIQQFAFIKPLDTLYQYGIFKSSTRVGG
jgi:hypothetical protein